MRTILDELQSKAVSENVKAKNLALLNRVILQCKDYMQRCSVRQDLMCEYTVKNSKTVNFLIFYYWLFRKDLIGMHEVDLHFYELVGQDLFLTENFILISSHILEGVKKNAISALGLFSALPSLIESRDKELESELEIFFASESNDNLMGSSNRCPIDIFQSAYVKLKHSKSAEILVCLFFSDFARFIYNTLIVLL